MTTDPRQAEFQRLVTLWEAQCRWLSDHTEDERFDARFQRACATLRQWGALGDALKAEGVNPW